MAQRYRVTDQRQTTQLALTGRFEDVMQVFFVTTDSGVSASVNVPLAQYTPEHVQTLIDAYVDNIEGVHQL